MKNLHECKNIYSCNILKYEVCPESKFLSVIETKLVQTKKNYLSRKVSTNLKLFFYTTPSSALFIKRWRFCCQPCSSSLLKRRVRSVLWGGLSNWSQQPKPYKGCCAAFAVRGRGLSLIEIILFVTIPRRCLYCATQSPEHLAINIGIDCFTSL